MTEQEYESALCAASLKADSPFEVSCIPESLRDRWNSIRVGAPPWGHWNVFAFHPHNRCGWGDTRLEALKMAWESQHAEA